MKIPSFTIPVLDFAIKNPENTPENIRSINGLDGLKQGDFLVSYSAWDGLKRATRPFLVAQMIGHAPCVKSSQPSLETALSKARVLMGKWLAMCFHCKGTGTSQIGKGAQYEQCKGCKGTGKPLVKAPRKRRAR